MNNTISTMVRIAVRISSALLAATLGFAAHAGDADDKIAVAKAAVEHAERAGASEAAPVALAAARDKLARAEKANSERDIKPAAALADQANIDAQVAEATAVQARSTKAAAEFDAGLQTLRQETAISSQQRQ
jgi:Domain of unknown function (DUF4398)